MPAAVPHVKEWSMKSSYKVRHRRTVCVYPTTAFSRLSISSMLAYQLSSNMDGALRFKKKRHVRGVAWRYNVKMHDGHRLKRLIWPCPTLFSSQSICPTYSASLESPKCPLMNSITEPPFVGNTKNGQDTSHYLCFGQMFRIHTDESEGEEWN